MNQPQPTNFTGTWIRQDPPGPRTLVVEQSDTVLRFTQDDGSRIHRSAFSLAGQILDEDTDDEDGLTEVRWEGQKLLLVTRGKHPRLGLPLELVNAWTLSADGQTLFVEKTAGSQPSGIREAYRRA